MNRTLTVLVVPANHPDEIDAMSFDQRRSDSGGWTRIEVLHGWEPDVLVRKALDVDMGVYGAAPEPDREDDDCTVETSLITADHLGYASGLLTPLLAAPVALASRLIAHAGSDEDPAHVARVLAEVSRTPARGPAEEAAAYIRIFMGYVPLALDSRMGIAWELRTYAEHRPTVMVKDVTVPYGWETVAPPPSMPTPMPSRPTTGVTWMRSGEETMRLVQNPSSVTVIVGEGSGEERTEVATLFALRGLREWIEGAAARVRASRSRRSEPFTVEGGFTPGEVDGIVGRVRAGMEVVIGGSRVHSTYRGNGTDLLVEDFDEGATSERTITEEELRATIAGSANEFVGVARAPFLEAFREALLGDVSRGTQRERLRDLDLFGDCLHHRHLVEAVLDWPETKPSPEMLARIAKTDGLDVFHAIRSAIGYGTRSIAAGEYGVRFFDALEAMVGERDRPARWRRYRAEFRDLAGDSKGALEDLAWELARLARDDSDRTYLEREMAKISDRVLLAAIAAAPGDDGPRLVWADVLSERGDPRGEMIAAQCRMDALDPHDPLRATLLPRVLQLVAHHGRTWGKRGRIYERGFPSSAEVRWVAFREEADELFAVSPPLRELRFRSLRNERMDSPWEALCDARVERLPALDLSDPRFLTDNPEDQTTLLAYPFGAELVRQLGGRLPGLRELTMRASGLTAAESFELIGARAALTKLDLSFTRMAGFGALLLGGTGLSELESLTLVSCELEDADVGRLPRLRRLEDLDLRKSALGPGAAGVLAELRLRSLRLSDTSLGDEGARTLARIASLVALDLSSSQIGNDGVASLATLPLASLTLEDGLFDEVGVEALARGPIAATIRRLSLGRRGDRKLGPEAPRRLTGMPLLWELDLRGCAMSSATLVALLDALPALRVLRLAECALGDEGLATLVAHPRFAELETLDLEANGLTAAAGAILARAPRLPLRLELNGNALRDEGARAIAQAAAASRLTHLLLRDNGLGDEGALALVAETSHVRHVADLTLKGNAIGADARQTLFNELGPRLID